MKNFALTCILSLAAAHKKLKSVSMNDFDQLKFVNKVNHFNEDTTKEEQYYG